MTSKSLFSHSKIFLSISKVFSLVGWIEASKKGKTNTIIPIIIRLKLENIVIELGMLWLKIPAVLFAKASLPLDRVSGIEPESPVCHTIKPE